MKIYTRTGDQGETALFGGGRVSKDDVRVSAYGSLDELNAVVGLGIVEVVDDDVRRYLGIVQHDLFAIGSDLATPPARAGRSRPDTPELPVGRIVEMEGWIDRADERLAPLRAFILPGGSRGAASLHLARTVCRRTERLVVGLSRTDEVDPSIIAYLNRLSDVFFTFARLENAVSGHGDVEWQKP